MDVGLRRVVQISALGDPTDGEFIAAKHRADAALMAMDLDWVVLRPSLVYSTEGSYGGSSLLRAMAAFSVVPLAGGGTQPVQPIAAQDVAAAVVSSLEHAGAARCCLDLVGPETISLRAYLMHWRQWLGLGSPVFVNIPAPFARIGTWFADRFGRGPFGMTTWRMLERALPARIEAWAQVSDMLGVQPRTLASALAARPAHSADRWQARLYPLMPLLRVVLALTWAAAGIVGLCMSHEQIAALFAPIGLQAETAIGLGWAASVTDVLLGVLLLIGWRVRLVLALMAASVVAYTIYIGIWLPSEWRDPFGGLAKNFVILVALAIAAVTAERS